MAGRNGKLSKFLESTAGHIVSAVLYAVMLVLVCMYFTGNGTFIYEAF